MRSNLEDGRIRRPRLFSPTHDTVTLNLTSPFLVPDDGPTFLFLTPVGANQSVYLPQIPPQGGMLFIAVNNSAIFDLTVLDDLGGAIGTIQEGQLALLISSQDSWEIFLGFPASYNDFISGLLTNPRQVTADFATFPTDTTIAVVRAAPALTLGTLPTVASRNGRPISIVDWSSGVVDHEIRLTPDGTETVMKQATWSFWSNAGNLASGTLWPSTDLNGWYIKP